MTHYCLFCSCLWTCTKAALKFHMPFIADQEETLLVKVQKQHKAYIHALHLCQGTWCLMHSLSKAVFLHYTLAYLCGVVSVASGGATHSRDISSLSTLPVFLILTWCKWRQGKETLTYCQFFTCSTQRACFSNAHQAHVHAVGHNYSIMVSFAVWIWQAPPMMLHVRSRVERRGINQGSSYKSL